MVGDIQTVQSQIDKELVTWIDTIPFSKPTKNLTRDFSDAVLMAEILKLYYPRHVELHNYVPANNLNRKKENWNMLNRKVLAKLDLKLNKDTIHRLANASQGTIEKLLLELRTKILKDDEMCKRNLIKQDVENEDLKTSDMLCTFEDKIKDNSSQNNVSNSSKEDSNKLNNKVKNKPIKFQISIGRGISVVFSWIIYFFRIWNIFSYCRPSCFSKHGKDVLIDVATKQSENVIDEIKPIYAELKQELQEKEEIICTLTHKVAYLESSMKLKDLRISSLTAEILQNSTDMNHTTMSRSTDNARVKLRSRSHNFFEDKANSKFV